MFTCGWQLNVIRISTRRSTAKINLSPVVQNRSRKELEGLRKMSNIGRSSVSLFWSDPSGFYVEYKVPVMSYGTRDRCVGEER